MKFIRLRVANYRGIAFSEVEFAHDGITLIQGPNEAGKTSLSEAIRILFDYQDSTKHRDVEAIQPVHQDKGPEIELEAETGPYAFTYFKRFAKKPETKLTITKPKPENLTGREAHDRAEAILQETIDVDLWRALGVHQGEEIRQPKLDNQASLSAALDRAAGGRPTDPREEGIFNKVHEEYLRYFTENGAERKEVANSRKDLSDAQDEVEKIENKIQELESDIERAASLDDELKALSIREYELNEQSKEYRRLIEDIETLEAAVTEAGLKLQAAESSELAARQSKEARQALIDNVSETDKKYGEMKVSNEAASSSSSQAKRDLEHAQEAFAGAEGRESEARKLVVLRRADFDYYNNKLYLEQLSERKERIDEARKKAIRAEEILATNKVDEETLESIQEAERDWLAASAQLEIGAPSVNLYGLTDSQIVIDDVEVKLGKGHKEEFTVSDKVKMTVPGILDIEITAGSSIEGLSNKAENAKQALEGAYEAAGVSSGDEARKAAEDHREALRAVESKGRTEKENLRDLSYEELSTKLLGLQQSVPEYIDKREKEPAICPDMKSAKSEWEKAETAHSRASEEKEAKGRDVDTARGIRDGFNDSYIQSQTLFKELEGRLAQMKGNLGSERKLIQDEALEVNWEEALRTVNEEKTKVDAAEESLKEKDPERIRALAETAEGSLSTIQNRKTAAHTELTQVQTRLKIHGEEGLHEQLHAEQTKLERIEYINAALLRRAAVTRRLYETMREERDKSRKAYVAPLKDKIEILGRLLFNNSFEVEISDELQIVSRTENGVTVPFNSLSGGTREQLSLIFRLACSIIVAQDGGTPIILDDALGYTDPKRLRLMGAILARAAKECQIVIFTCTPERYCNVGEASIVSLG